MLRESREFTMNFEIVKGRTTLKRIRTRGIGAVAAALMVAGLFYAVAPASAQSPKVASASERL